MFLLEGSKSGRVKNKIQSTTWHTYKWVHCGVHVAIFLHKCHFDVHPFLLSCAFHQSMFSFLSITISLFKSCKISPHVTLWLHLKCRETSVINSSTVSFPGYGLFRQLAEEECSSVASSYRSQASSAEIRCTSWQHITSHGGSYSVLLYTLWFVRHFRTWLDSLKSLTLFT